jgi:hypothetical protein
MSILALLKRETPTSIFEIFYLDSIERPRPLSWESTKVERHDVSL